MSSKCKRSGLVALATLLGLLLAFELALTLSGRNGVLDQIFLRMAASEGDTTLVKLLLDWGGDIHVRQDEPLIFAAHSGHTQTVKALLSRGANIHAQNDLALFSAARNGHLETVKVLLDHGANIIGCHGTVVLRVAEDHGHSDVAKYIRKRIVGTPQLCGVPLQRSRGE